MAALNVDRYQDATELGSGANTPCRAEYGVRAQFEGGLALGLPVERNPNSTSPGTSQILSTPTPGSVNLSFSLQFQSPNMPIVDTCGQSRPIWSAPFSSNNTSFTFPIPIEGHVVDFAMSLPFQQSFHYEFGPNSGFWAIQNLSAPGGPGGGWAFDLQQPCS
jgi:hypothetical protein